MKEKILFFRRNFEKSQNLQMEQRELSHLKSLRLFDKEKQVEIRNGNGESFYYFVAGKKRTGLLVATEKSSITKTNLQIATALPAGGRFEFLLQKCSELAISKFFFVNYTYSDRKKINPERVEKIISEAAAQARLHFLPDFELYQSLDDFLSVHHRCFFLHPYHQPAIPSTVLSQDAIAIIGPEGGFSPDELLLLQQKQVPGYALGENILKIETACIHIVGLMHYFRSCYVP